MNQNSFALEVLINGRPAREFTHEQRTFVEGREKTQYSLRVRNNTFKRALAVVSVDGLDVLTGKIAKPENGGYVIEAWSSVEIKGFRESDTAVGAFMFTEKSASYAAAKGGDQNVGVIGVRIFEEKEVPQPVPIAITYYPTRVQYASGASLPDAGFHTGCMNSLTFSSTVETGPEGLLGHHGTPCSDLTRSAYTSQVQTPKRAKASFDLGTTWGNRVKDKVTTVTFKRGDIVGALDLFYASRASLAEMGIKFVEETGVSFPEAFPNKYATPPANWRG